MIAPEADPNRVRVAGPADEEELLDLAQNLHLENAVYPISKPKVLSELRASLGSTDGRQQEGIIGVVGDGRIEGAAWLVYCQEWYTDAFCLAERFIHVLPEYRRSTHAKDLIAWAKRISERTAPLHIGILSNDRTEAKVRLYCKHLGKPAGAYWLYGATTGHRNI